MASERNPPAQADAAGLVERKLALLRDVLARSQEQLLLVSMDELSPLLERKEALIEEMSQVDRELVALGPEAISAAEAESRRSELTRLVDAILENERTMEGRMQEERSRLRGELQALERQSRVKQYLESARPQGRTVDIKR
ncbi:MAG: hypothetical protein IIA41_00465 [SAR324 cluster bacterium]|nr:hypothetical protein [SAR324 cluster bacterium]